MNAALKPFFFEKNLQGLADWRDGETGKHLEYLVFQVARKPRKLELHLARIHHCYFYHTQEQLFAALLDFLIILGDKGNSLAQRIVLGSKNKLDADQTRMLTNRLENNLSQPSAVLDGSRYSLFSKGLLSVAELICLDTSGNHTFHDPLRLARDYIEFSQIENAVETLEEAIISYPERLELHEELLALYESTRDKTGFKRVFNILSSSDVTLPEKWQQLDSFFDSKQL